MVDYPAAPNDRSIATNKQQQPLLNEQPSSSGGPPPTHPIHSVSLKNLSKVAPHSAQEGSSTRIGSASGYSLRKFDPNEAMLHQRILARQSMQILHRNNKDRSTTDEVVVNTSMKSFNSQVVIGNTTKNAQSTRPY